MINATWSDIKYFHSSNRLASELCYVELQDKYIIWVQWKGVKLTHTLFKDSDDMTEFVTSYKPLANIQRAERMRIVTCQFGRRTNYRYISFTTAHDQYFDNTDYLERDFGDVTYTLKDANGNTTTNNSLAIETHISFLPTYDFEISGGVIDIPVDLGTSDLDLWELHVVAAPRIPAAHGGQFPFFANNRLKFNRGMRIGMDESLNPAEMSGAASIYAREILIIIKHPIGTQREFQIMLKLFREA